MTFTSYMVMQFCNIHDLAVMLFRNTWDSTHHPLQAHWRANEETSIQLQQLVQERQL
jgi:hypothetical protein